MNERQNLIWPYSGMLLRLGPEQYGGSSEN